MENKRVAAVLAVMAASLCLTSCGSTAGSESTAEVSTGIADTEESTGEVSSAESSVVDTGTSEASTEVTTEETEAVIDEDAAFAALAESVGSASSDTNFRYIYLDDDTVPELFSCETGDTESVISLLWYGDGRVQSKALGSSVYFIPESGSIIAEDTAMDEDDPDQETTTDTLYCLQDGVLEETGHVGTNVVNHMEGTEVLTVDGSEVDRSGYLSFFDFDHALFVSSGRFEEGSFTGSLMQQVLEDHGEVDRTEDLSLYVDCVQTREEEMGTGSYQLLDLDGDGSRELIRYSPNGDDIYTVVDGQTVQLNAGQGTVEVAYPEPERHLIYLSGPNLHVWYQGWEDAYLVENGQTFRICGETYFYGQTEDGDYEDGTYGYPERTFLNGLCVEDFEESMFTDLVADAAGEAPEDEESKTQEAYSSDEMLAILTAEKEEEAPDWKKSYALTLAQRLREAETDYDGTEYFPWASTGEGTKFVLQDVDGDGTPELFIGDWLFEMYEAGEDGKPAAYLAEMVRGFDPTAHLVETRLDASSTYSYEENTFWKLENGTLSCDHFICLNSGYADGSYLVSGSTLTPYSNWDEAQTQVDSEEASMTILTDDPDALQLTRENVIKALGFWTADPMPEEQKPYDSSQALVTASENLQMNWKSADDEAYAKVMMGLMESAVDYYYACEEPEGWAGDNNILIDRDGNAIEDPTTLKFILQDVTGDGRAELFVGSDELTSPGWTMYYWQGDTLTQFETLLYITSVNADAHTVAVTYPFDGGSVDELLDFSGDLTSFNRDERSILGVYQEQGTDYYYAAVTERGVNTHNDISQEETQTYVDQIYAGQTTLTGGTPMTFPNLWATFGDSVQY